MQGAAATLVVEAGASFCRSFGSASILGNSDRSTVVQPAVVQAMQELAVCSLIDAYLENAIEPIAHGSEVGVWRVGLDEVVGWAAPTMAISIKQVAHAIGWSGVNGSRALPIPSRR